MGFEHGGFVIGEGLMGVGERHHDVLTGQQFQSRHSASLYRLFYVYTHVKFYQRSLGDAGVALMVGCDSV
ncbi:hypothetical protein [Kribbella sp. CA-294648]|uniref:hypothetical protein n=1 Tax=Kribbella sp. CA-294648 TaxID=3239948 RepID=UPI003D8BA688